MPPFPPTPPPPVLLLIETRCAFARGAIRYADAGLLSDPCPRAVTDADPTNCIGEYCVDVDDDGVIDGCSDTDCPGDIHGDRQVEAADLGLLIGTWDTDNPDADIDGDGNVDGADLAFILGYWGLCDRAMSRTRKPPARSDLGRGGSSLPIRPHRVEPDVVGNPAGELLGSA